MAQSLSPIAVEVLLRIRFFGDPLAAPLPPDDLLQSLCELRAAGLIEPVGERFQQTAAGKDWWPDSTYPA